MNAGLAWMLAGIVLCGAELLHPGVFLLWIGLAAAGAGVATWAAGFPFVWQVAAFLVLLAALLGVPSVRRQRSTPDGVNAPDSGLIGKTCRALAFEGAEGRVSFRDGTWPARATGPAPAPGTVLRVIGLDGTTLLVTPEP